MYYSSGILLFLMYCASLPASIYRVVLVERKAFLSKPRRVYLISVNEAQKVSDSTQKAKYAQETDEAAEELLYWFDRAKDDKKLLLDSLYPYDSLFAESFAPLAFCYCLIQKPSFNCIDDEEIIKKSLKKKDETNLLHVLGKKAHGRKETFFVSEAIAELEANLAALRGYDCIFKPTLRDVYNKCSAYAGQKGRLPEEFLKKIDERLTDFTGALEKAHKLLKNKKQKAFVKSLINSVENSSRKRFIGLRDTLNTMQEAMKLENIAALTVQEMMLQVALSYLNSGMSQERFYESHILFSDIPYPKELVAYYSVEHLLAPHGQSTVFCVAGANIADHVRSILTDEGYTVLLDSYHLFPQKNSLVEKELHVPLTNEQLGQFFYRSFADNSFKQEL